MQQCMTPREDYHKDALLHNVTIVQTLLPYLKLLSQELLCSSQLQMKHNFG